MGLQSEGALPDDTQLEFVMCRQIKKKYNKNKY